MTGSGTSHCSKYVMMFRSGTLPFHAIWLTSPPAPKSAALRTRRTASRTSAGCAGDSIRLFSKPPQKTVRPRRATPSYKIIQRPLGMNGVDPDRDQIVEHVANRAAGQKKREFVVVAESAEVAKQRQNQRPPEDEVHVRAGRPSQIVAHDDAVDLCFRPLFGFLAVEVVEASEQVAEFDIALGQFTEGDFRACN